LVEEIVETEGHLIDSRLMTEIFDAVVKHGASFEVLEFTIGRTNDDYSRLQMRVTAPESGVMQDLLEELLEFGCRTTGEQDAELQPAPIDGCAPDDFYSTSNHRTGRPVGSFAISGKAIESSAFSMAFGSCPSSASAIATVLRS
jgi:hypothetical protein